jgi:hypothetical protein
MSIYSTARITLAAFGLVVAPAAAFAADSPAGVPWCSASVQDHCMQHEHGLAASGHHTHHQHHHHR